MPRVSVYEETWLAPQTVLDAACDFSERRADRWPDVHVEHLTVHEAGEDFAEVTEGNPWPIGHVWERLRYDWSEPGLVRGTVIASNLFKPGSTWELHAEQIPAGSRVQIVGVRHLAGRGWLLYPFFPFGVVKSEVADHLRHFLRQVESEEA